MLELLKLLRNVGVYGIHLHHGCMKKKKIQSVLVDCQRGIGGTLRVKPLTWGHGSNFGSLGIWVVTIRKSITQVSTLVSTSFTKFLVEVWVPIALAFIFLIVVYVWHYGTLKKY